MGGRGIAPLILNPGSRQVGGELHASLALPLERIPVHTGWAPEPVWMFLEKRKSVAPTGIRTPDWPAS